MDYAERQKQPKTVPPDLVRALWLAVKSARDEASYAKVVAAHREALCNDLLERMKAAGMADHLATLEEAQASWRGE